MPKSMACGLRLMPNPPFNTDAPRAARVSHWELVVTLLGGPPRTKIAHVFQYVVVKVKGAQARKETGRVGVMFDRAK